MMGILVESRLPVCLECGSRNVINDHGSGEVVCGECGLVIAESPISADPEWRAFTFKERETRTRTGSPLCFYIYDKGLSTVINPFGKDAHGRSIPHETKIQMMRLSRWQIRSKTQLSQDRNLAQAMNELDRLSYRLRVTQTVKEQAAIIYRKALKKGIVRGRSISAIVAASLYTALRITNTPKTLREVASHSPIEKKEISRCYRLLLTELKIRVPVSKAQLMVPKISSKISLSGETQRKAIEILDEADRLKLTVGRGPNGLAAAALYLASLIKNEKRTQKEIADAAEVIEVTVRNRYKEMKEHLGLR